MTEKAKQVIKEVNATMALEGMPLSDFDIELLAKLADGELTIDEIIAIFNEKYSIKPEK